MADTSRINLHIVIIHINLGLILISDTFRFGLCIQIHMQIVAGIHCLIQNRAIPDHWHIHWHIHLHIQIYRYIYMDIRSSAEIFIWMHFSSNPDDWHVQNWLTHCNYTRIEIQIWFNLDHWHIQIWLIHSDTYINCWRSKFYHPE